MEQHVEKLSKYFIIAQEKLLKLTFSTDCKEKKTGRFEFWHLHNLHNKKNHFSLYHVAQK